MGLYKNSGKYPEAANRAIDFVGMIPGKRDSYRIVGERVFTQRDIEKGWESMPDQVGAVGWPLEDQTSEGFYARGKKPAIYGGQVPFYNLPLSIMCAKGFSNLMMAGRNMSASHLAFTSTRVMNSCSVAGQAAGTAAAMCARENLAPRDISASVELSERLRQNLLKDGQIILGAKTPTPSTWPGPRKSRQPTPRRGQGPKMSSRACATTSRVQTATAGKRR